MQFIYITCNISMLEIITDLLDEIEIMNYQVIEQVTAKSHYDNPRLNTAIWPGFNASLLIQEENIEKTDDLLLEIKQFNQKAYNNGELIVAYRWSIEKWIDVKPISQIHVIPQNLFDMLVLYRIIFSQTTGTIRDVISDEGVVMKKE